MVVLRRFVALLLRVGVVSVVVAMCLLSLAQHTLATDNAWLEITRYLPYPFLLLPAVAALIASRWLGRAWLACCAANLALLLTLGMGLQWHTGDVGSGGPAQVRLMTYNVKFQSPARRKEDTDALAREVAQQQPDILVMQDADGLHAGRVQPAAPYGPIFGLSHVYAFGQFVVASRHALRECRPGDGVDGASPAHVSCVVNVRGVDLEVVTAHFQSPRAGLNAARREGIDGADDWRRNYRRRLAQARALARELPTRRRPLVVAGDLNAPESSPVVHALLDVGLRDAFSNAGRGYGYSHGHSLRIGIDLLRIDHILLSPDIAVQESHVGGASASDHRPVIADLVLRR